MKTMEDTTRHHGEGDAPPPDRPRVDFTDPESVEAAEARLEGTLERIADRRSRQVRDARLEAEGFKAPTRALAADEHDLTVHGLLLLDGRLEGCRLEVLMPNGETWLYSMGVNAAPVWVLVQVDLRAPQAANVYRPGAEGVHPFVGVASRHGVERRKA